MAYAQWIKMDIHPEKCDVTIKNAALKWGKFHQPEDKNKEISIDDINGTIISAGGHAVIASSGREDASSGTEGSIDLYDGNVKIGTYIWDCPWGSKNNISEWHRESKAYSVDISGANLYGGAIGTVTIEVYKK